MKELLKKAFNAGASYATASHFSLEQTHPNFHNWHESLDVWQPIETAPKGGTHIITYDVELDSLHLNPYDICHWHVENYYTEYWKAEAGECNPTHWMPLPEAPKD